MKKLRAHMDKWFDNLDQRWRKLPVRNQRKYTLYFFLGYVLISAGVFLKIWYDEGKSNQGIIIEHIENPVIKKDEPAKRTVDTILD